MKKFKEAATIIAVIAVAVIVLGMIFGNMGIFISIGILLGVNVIACMWKPAAGVVVVILSVIGLGLYGPRIYNEIQRADNPNGLFASFFSKLDSQNQSAVQDYRVGSGMQAEILAGTMSIEQKLSKHFADTTAKIVQAVGKSSPLGLTTNQKTALLGLGDQIQQNKKDLTQVLERAGVLQPTVSKPKSVEIKVDITDPDGYTLVVPPGMQVSLSVVEAHYTLMKVRNRQPNGAILSEVDLYVDANGLVTDDPDDRYVAPLARYATIYKDDGKWKDLNMDEKAVVDNRGSSPKEVVITVNDIQGTYDTNKGTLVIRYELSPILVNFVSAD